jgi:hypothetical protein
VGLDLKRERKNDQAEKNAAEDHAHSDFTESHTSIFVAWIL